MEKENFFSEITQKINIVNTTSASNAKIPVDELVSMTAHVCFQIYHIPPFPLSKYLEMATSYIAPLINILEGNADFPHMFVRKVYARIAARYGEYVLEEALIDYFLERDNNTVPTFVALGMKSFLVPLAQNSLCRMIKLMCREGDSFETILDSLRTTRIALFIDNLSFLVQSQFTAYFLEFFPLKTIKLDDAAIPLELLPEYWNILSRALSKNFLNIGNRTIDILAVVENSIIPYLSKIDPTCYLLENSLLKIKDYLKNQTDFDYVFISFLTTLSNKTPGDSLIEFDHSNQFKEEFLDLSIEEWKADPDFCTEVIRRSTKSLSPLNIFANLYPSQECLIKSLQKTLMNDYLLKGDLSLDLKTLCWRLGSSANCLLVMKNDCTFGDEFIISECYWPKFPKIDGSKDAGKSSRKGELLLTWHFDLYLVELTFPQGPYEVYCSQSQLKFITKLATEGSSSGGMSNVEDGDVIFWLKHGVVELDCDQNVRFSPSLRPKVDAAIYKAKDSVSSKSNLDESVNNHHSSLSDIMPFIKAMLMNRGPMDVNKIHSTLLMFSSEYVAASIPQEELLTFLETRVTQEGELVFDQTLSVFRVK